MTAGGNSVETAALDAERVRAALAVAGEDDRAGWVLTQLAGGWSRHTYVLADGGEPRYVVRVKPPGALLETGLVREYRTYAALDGLPIPAPRVFGVDESEETPFGGPYFVQEWLPGDGPNVWQRRNQQSLEENWRTSRSLAEDFLGALVEIHAADAARFENLGPPVPFAEKIAHWRGTYEKMRLVQDPIVDEAFRWVSEREPARPHLGLVHGDYRIGNTLVDGDRITAVVDWELAYLGDTDYDLGYLSLDYLAGRFVRPGSELVAGVADESWFFEQYETRTGRSVDPEAVRTYSALGALVLITILSTGIRMYTRGENPDVRMAWNRYAVPGLRQELTRLMGW